MSRFITRDEMEREIRRAKALGDESTITVEDSPGGQVVRDIALVGGGDEQDTSAFDAYWFIVTEDTGASVKISPGVFVHGEDVETIPASTFTMTASGYLVFLAYYSGGWQFDYQESTSVPPQIKHSGNWAERFSIAYVTLDSGNVSNIEQLNIKEIRSTRLA